MDLPAPGAVIESVVIKFSAFNPIDPELWFIQCEAQFAQKNVTVDQTKYYHVVAASDLLIQQCIKATLKVPSVADKFNRLKQVILTMYGLSDEQKAEKF